MTDIAKQVRWLNTPFSQQTAAEIGQLCEQIHSQGFKSLLEIGSCLGWSLILLAEAMGPGAKIRSIDLGVINEINSEHNGYSNREQLESVIGQLNANGFDAEVLFADSHSEEAVKWAQVNGPYHLVMIDGDHSYEGVKQDYVNYGPMGHVVAFHDVKNEHLGVMQFWEELRGKVDNRFLVEFFAPMGIGVINQQAPE